MQKKPPCLYIVIPCYNEESVLPIMYQTFLQKLNSLISHQKITDDSKILFVDDGSNDKTWEFMEQLSKKNPYFCCIKLSRNRGHQHALLAGLMEAKSLCDITISIDCDGQDDINAMDEMIEKYMQGNEIVYGVRSARKTDTFFKRFTAETFYKLLNRMGAEIIYNHADYRLISQRVLNAFADFREVNIFLRGLFPLVGFKSDIVYYERNERIAGKSHYPLTKMLALALDGITSLSIKPMHIVTTLGLSIMFLSLIGILWIFIVTFAGKTTPGWASMTLILCFLGGIQMLSLGIIGEYIGKIYLETKSRPRFVIEKRTFKK